VLPCCMDYRNFPLLWATEPILRKPMLVRILSRDRKTRTALVLTGGEQIVRIPLSWLLYSDSSLSSSGQSFLQGSD
jgi:hypothetical protein